MNSLTYYTIPHAVTYLLQSSNMYCNHLFIHLPENVFTLTIIIHLSVCRAFYLSFITAPIQPLFHIFLALSFISACVPLCLFQIAPSLSQSTFHLSLWSYQIDLFSQLQPSSYLCLPLSILLSFAISKGLSTPVK